MLVSLENNETNETSEYGHREKCATIGGFIGIANDGFAGKPMKPVKPAITGIGRCATIGGE